MNFSKNDDICKILFSTNKKIFKLINHLNGYHVVLKLQLHLFEMQNEKFNTKENSKYNILNKNLLQTILDEKKDGNKVKNNIDYEISDNSSNPLNLYKIIKVVNDNFDDICYDENGCCYIQRTLESFIDTNFGNMISNRLLLNIHNYIIYNYSNYTIQNMIRMNFLLWNEYIFSEIKSDFLKYSLEEHSSKIVNSLIKYFLKPSEKGIDFLIEFVLEDGSIEELIFNKYGFIGKKNFFLIF